MNAVLQRRFRLGSAVANWHSRDMAAALPDRDDFVRQWNALARADRLRIRRLVRLGRPLDSPGAASLAVAYSAVQRSRPWEKYFWLWFIPGLVIALGIAVQIHPIVLGIVLALSAQAVFTHRNLRRVERVNSELLGQTAP